MFGEPVPTQSLVDELEGREPKGVNAEEIVVGDKIQDEGWVKSVTGLAVVEDEVVLSFAKNPFSPMATYRVGHPALVYRVVPDVER